MGKISNEKPQLVIRRNIKSSNIGDAMKYIKKEFPRARMVTYKYKEDYRFANKKDYKNRTMMVAFINDFELVKKLF